MDYKLSGAYIYDIKKDKDSNYKGITFYKVAEIIYSLYDKRNVEYDRVVLKTSNRKLYNYRTGEHLKKSTASLIREANDKGHYLISVKINEDDKEEIKVSTVNGTDLSYYLRSFVKDKRVRIKNMSDILNLIAETYGEKKLYTNKNIEKIIESDEFYECIGLSKAGLELEELKNQCGVANLYSIDVRPDVIVFAIDFLIKYDGKNKLMVRKHPKEFKKLIEAYYNAYACQELPFDRLELRSFKVITGMTIDFMCFPKTKEDSMRINRTHIRPKAYEPI